MTSMKVFWNDDYCGARTDFETLKKSRFVAQAIRQHSEISERVTVKDPAEITGALSEAQKVIADGLTTEYLSAVMTGRPRELAESNGFGWDEGIYLMVLNSTAGILCAVDAVLCPTCDDDHACSLSSGLHHARSNRGGGFCTVNSLALGALYAEKRDVGGVAILDLDAHCGGGTYEYIKDTTIKQFDLSTSNFDAYDAENLNYLQFCTDPKQYLDNVAETLDKLAEHKPSVVFYNAGVDIVPFVSPEIVYRREEMVAERLHGIGAKTVIVMAGGYGDYEDIVLMHLSTIMSFATPRLTTGHSPTSPTLVEL